MTVRNRAEARFDAIKTTGTRSSRKFETLRSLDGSRQRTSEYFGVNTFSFALMEKKLQAKDVDVLREYATSDQPLNVELADKVAFAVKEWAISRGATHYCHWFQPHTGLTAEKHDSFFSLDKDGACLEKFTGKELIQSEPDASSFPSGGIRSTFEARGYTVWDASSPMFLMESDNGLTLCIPSLFISYSGEALDKKTPLLRSMTTINQKATEALNLLGYEDVTYVTANAGPEQEYYVVDESFFNLRPDLLLAGRTLIGRAPPRGQQLEDHYFGAINKRILNYMMECEYELYKLGVPCKTRHNEVGPAQYEMAPIFETANVAADHNQLVMEVFKSVAKRHRLKAMFHEKPYADINGSGKHVNWSLSDKAGTNLLEPGEKPKENIRFLYFLAATIKAIHDNGALLRMAAGTPGNEFRLGANEAPPAIMSVFLGESLTELLDEITGTKPCGTTSKTTEINLDLAKVPVISRDNTDRNRTSPFAFTGNKFEFRAVGASASISPSICYLNTTVAKALSDMNKALASSSKGKKATQEEILGIIQETLSKARKVCYEGNNYSEEWHKEAKKRGLPIYKTTPDALATFLDPKIQATLKEMNILTPNEAIARYNVRLERYTKIRLIELETLLEIVSTHVFPAALSQQSLVAESLETTTKVLNKPPVLQTKQLEELVAATDKLVESQNALDKLIKEVRKADNPESNAKRLATEGMELMEVTRSTVNDLELLVDDTLWSLPKYREMLYLL